MEVEYGHSNKKWKTEEEKEREKKKQLLLITPIYFTSQLKSFIISNPSWFFLNWGFTNFKFLFR